jgi:hypothetical protein
MKFNIGVCVLIALIIGAEFLRGSGLPPNRGTQLFVLIQKKVGQTHIIAMKPRRPVLEGWNRYTGQYDFILGVVRRTRDGSKVRFTRCVMKEDYVPCVQQRICSSLMPRSHITGFLISVRSLDFTETRPMI